VEVMRELQRRRTATAVFAGKDGFITARDLLRCAPQPFSVSSLRRRAAARLRG
jgi:midasin (ATPase involved in ribosome maturation)